MLTRKSKSCLLFLCFRTGWFNQWQSQKTTDRQKDRQNEIQIQWINRKCTMVQNKQESGEVDRLFACSLTHSFTCSALLALLEWSAALICLHAHSLTRSHACGKTKDQMSQYYGVLTHCAKEIQTDLVIGRQKDTQTHRQKHRQTNRQTH